jgi:UDP-N-acetylglucosamine:LPS N-acetylglucosamine transferase
MKKIIYYISDHGKGHTTRSIAVIRELKKLNIEVTIRNSNSQAFINESLPGMKVIEGITDVGPSINKNGISIDEKKSNKNITNWIETVEEVSNRESMLIKKINPNLIISDISVMPLLASYKNKIPAITISNFSWYDVLKFLPKNSLNKLYQYYDFSDLHIQLPLSTGLNHFKRKKSVGFVARKQITSSINLRKNLGIKKEESMILVALGNSKELKFKSNNNFKFLSINSKINNQNNLIDVTNWIEGQDLVAAADLVICKCGYGFISECLTNSTPFFYTYSENHLEQREMSQKLKKMGIKNQISVNEINDLNFTKEFMTNLPHSVSKNNDTKDTIEVIKEYL